jgi:polyhydroxyalkanoate synthesis regulator phasin
MAAVFAVVAGYMMYLLMGAPAPWRQEAQELSDEALRYSGINPEEFRNFADEMKQAEELVVKKPRQAAKHLYKALDHFESLGTHNNYDVQEEIHEIAEKIGIAVEQRILESALKLGINWTPRYLNNTFI